MGRGRGDQHLQTPGSKIPIVGLDYFYITKEAVYKREELEYPQTAEGDQELDNARTAGELLKCLVVRCTISKNIFGHVVPCKGADEEDYVANLVVDDIIWLGHTELIMKGDNERSLQALVKRILEVIRVKATDVANITSETPPEYDSQSNGAVESGVRSIRGLFRTIRLCMEARIGKKLPIDHALVPWLLQHTCFLLNIKNRGADGLTGWARTRGRPFAQKILGFAEMVLYKFPTKGPGSAPDGNMGARWGEAIFLGFSRASNTYILGTKDGIITARSISRQPVPNRWSHEALSSLKSMPWSERQRHQPEVRFQDPAAEPDEVPDTATPAQVRRFRINAADLREHGHTDGCPQCSHVQRYGKTRQGLQHNQTCRDRIVTAIGSTPSGAARLEAYSERSDRLLAEHVEHADRTNAGGASPQEELGGASPQEELGHADRTWNGHSTAGRT